MKNKKLIKTAVISLFSVSVLMALFIGFSSLIGATSDMEISEIFYLYIGAVLIVYIPMLAFLCFSKMSFDFSKKIVEIENGQFDINKEKNYYRDILNNYTTLELAYIESMKELNEDDVIAELLTLEKKKVIKFENNKIVRINNNVSNSQGYLLKKSKSGKVVMDGYDEITGRVESELIQKGIIVKEKNILKDILMMILKTVLVVIASIVSLYVMSITEIYELNRFMLYFTGILFIILIVIIMFSFIYLISYTIHKINSYELTEKGKEIKIKLNGLKRYIKDFSNLDEKDKNFLTLWDEYLIYSVMFGENESVKKEMESLLDIKNSSFFTNKQIFVIAFIIALVLLILI